MVISAGLADLYATGNVWGVVSDTFSLPLEVTYWFL
jgi:hypothetical protein